MNDFKVKINSATSKFLVLDITFSAPQIFSREGSSQNITIYAQFSDFEPGWDDTAALLNLKIPKQVSNDVMAIQSISQLESVATSTQVATAVALCTNIVLSGAMA